MSFNFMAAVTIYSDFGAQENKILSLFPESGKSDSSPYIKPKMCPFSLDSVSLTTKQGIKLNLVLKFYHASESPGGFVKAQSARPPNTDPLIQNVQGRAGWWCRNLCVQNEILGDDASTPGPKITL